MSGYYYYYIRTIYFTARLIIWLSSTVPFRKPDWKDLWDSLNHSWNVFPLDILVEPQSLDRGFIQTSFSIKCLSPLAHKATQRRTTR